MASVVICLATGRKFNFSKYIFDSFVRNVDSSSKFYKYLKFLQLMIADQVGDLTSHTTKYTSHALTQKVFANMRRVGKGFFGVNTPLFKGMLVQQQATDDVDVVVAPNVPADDVANVVADDDVADGEIIELIDADEDVTLEEVNVAKDAKVAEDSDDDKAGAAKLKEVIEVVTTAKLMIEVVTAAATIITPAATLITAATITAAPSAARRRKRGMSYDDIRPIFEKYFNSNVAFLEKSKQELEEEASRALKRKNKSSKEKAVKKQKCDEEVEGLKKHIQIVPNNEDDIYTEATPLALKFPVVDYEIHTENNKPYYKIIRADGTH
uniref:Uncharacterized protein n=1 Tax=Tanacetum cinerariifolium TaxID=118510 RepID=A0A6L2KA71_TANCI|nr:hypothetical protein [Tanacetum cinerariifolium]